MRKQNKRIPSINDMKKPFWLNTTHSKHAGFTMIELLVASAIMTIVIVGALALYSRSNQISVDQQQYAELQHDVRSALYFMTRDIRMAGAGLPPEFGMYSFEGTNNEDQSAEVRPDRISILGNMENPLNIRIQDYQGSSVTVSLEDGSFEQFPYPPEFYVNRIVLILPNPSSPCRTGEVRQLTHITWSTGGTNEQFNMSPGLAPGINPPGGLLAGSPCQSDDFDGGLIMFANVKEFWLDITGNYPGLTAGQNGYVGEPGILYMTNNSIHFPLAQNIENLQFEYNGDLNDDGTLDGFHPWDNTWSDDQVSRIRQIRIILVGRTPNRFVTVSGKVPANIYNYRRPPVSVDSPGATADDYHRRFVLETTVNVRNLSLNIYNTGQR
jgi:prepilin-type N-terminal cleavage/methylation domain-containing protein